MSNSVRFAFVGFLAFVLVAAVGGRSSAQKQFIKKIRRVYQLDPRKTGSCKLCHAPDEKKKEKPNEENLNVFGKAIHDHKDMKPLLGKGDEFTFTKAHLETLTKIVKALEAEDSDGDGATNGEELALDSFPGDKESKPDPKKLDAYRKKQGK